LPFCCFLNLNSSLLKKTNKKKGFEDTRGQGFKGLFYVRQTNAIQSLLFPFAFCQTFKFL
jgi:hypothetical protein